jgi:hypothetical protein
MIKVKRTPMDLMDDIYTLAYWLTGSELGATELVNRTYLNVEFDSSETEVFKTFRECYFDTIGKNCASSTPVTPETSLVQRNADIKLSVLLAEISGMKHRAISKIIGKPLNTTRLWLSSGRKSFASAL